MMKLSLREHNFSVEYDMSGKKIDKLVDCDIER